MRGDLRQTAFLLSTECAVLYFGLTDRPVSGDKGLSWVHRCMVWAIFPTSENTDPKIWHTSFTLMSLCGGRAAVVRITSVIVRRLFPKRIFLAGEEENNGRTSTEHLILIGRLSYDIRAMTCIFTGHRTNIARVSYGQRTMIVLPPTECI